MAQIDQGATTRRAHSRDAGTAPARRVQVQAAAHPHDHGDRRHAREDGQRDRRAAAAHSDRAQGRAREGGQRDGLPAHIGAPQVAEGEQGMGLEVLTALAELLRACRRYMGIACTHLDSLAQSLSATGLCKFCPHRCTQRLLGIDVTLLGCRQRSGHTHPRGDDSPTTVARAACFACPNPASTAHVKDFNSNEGWFSLQHHPVPLCKGNKVPNGLGSSIGPFPDPPTPQTLRHTFGSTLHTTEVKADKQGFQPTPVLDVRHGPQFIGMPKLRGGGAPSPGGKGK
eukprot:2504315-Amphidinium_carterae.1